MNIKIHSSELNRMMKIVAQCVDDRQEKFANVEISQMDNKLMIRGTNGQLFAEVFTMLLGDEGEMFCVDGTMFSKVCAMCNGDVNISTTFSDCYVKGSGRTRLPMVNVGVPKVDPIGGTEVDVKAENFSTAYASVAHAISTDQSRLQLTGVLTEVDETGLRMTTLDGFRLAIQTTDCDGDEMSVIIPGAFMKLMQTSFSPGETIHIITNKKRIEASTESVRIGCGLLTGEFPDINRIVPKDFATECLVNVEKVRNALRSSNTLNSKDNLVKVIISDGIMKIMSNSERADYEEEIPCELHGNGITTAFNQKFLMDTFNSITSESAVMKFNSPISPCVITGMQSSDIMPDGLRLILPVRVAG